MTNEERRLTKGEGDMWSRPYEASNPPTWGGSTQNRSHHYTHEHKTVQEKQSTKMLRGVIQPRQASRRDSPRSG